MKILLAQINPTIGSLRLNKEKIRAYLEKGRKEGVELVIFPEMALCGYPPEDLLTLPGFVEACEKELLSLAPFTKGLCAVVGGVRKNPDLKEKPLFNTAAIFENGTFLGFQDKTLLPDYDVFSERRYFEPAAQRKLWNLCGKKIAVTICEDLWEHAKAVDYSSYYVDPVLELKEKKPDLCINISASPFYLERQKTRLHVVSKAATTLQCPVAFCNQVGGNDSLIFDGMSLFMGKEGNPIYVGASFKEDSLLIDTEIEKKEIKPSYSIIEDLYNALVLGIKDYFGKQNLKKAILGLSGGIDSAVVATLAKEALGKENVLALMMPSRFTSQESIDDAKELSSNLGIGYKEISIEKPFQSFLSLLNLDINNITTTEENLQARIRGMILMAYSNKEGYIVLVPANKSEMAMGYATLYGDMCGGLGVLSDVSKKYVYQLSHWINRFKPIIPSRIVEKSPSAELKHNQKDSDTLPSYTIVDAVLEGYIEEHLSIEEIAKKNHIDLETVRSLVRRIHLNEYKRRQAPPGIRVTKKAFSLGRRFPIVQDWNINYP